MRRDEFEMKSNLNSKYGKTVMEFASVDTESSYLDTDSSYPDTESSYPDTESSYPDIDTESSYPDTESSYPDTESSYPDTESSYPDLNFTQLKVTLNERLGRERLSQQIRLYKELAVPFTCNKHSLINYINEFNKAIRAIGNIVTCQIYINIDDMYRDFEVNFDFYVLQDYNVNKLAVELENRLSEFENKLHSIVNSFN